MSRIASLLAGSGLPRHEAERLLVVASGQSRADLAVAGEVDGAAAERFGVLAARRRSGIPLQHLEGTVQFGPLELRTDGRALVPRPETEELWDRVVTRLTGNPPGVVVDLCTGSGNLALGLKHAFPDAEVIGTDLSQAALDLAAENGRTTGLDVTWLHGDLFDALPAELRGRVDALVANPPYVAAGDVDALPVDVRDHDPHDALVAGPRGDEVLARIAAGAAPWLAPGGLLACEIGADQGPRVVALFAVFDPTIEGDAAGRDRYVFGRRVVR